jgi:WD40-like Beta Propeller Repeat
MRTAFLAIALAVLIAAPARADLVAVAQVVAPGHSDTDIGLIDISTGGRLALPAGINTAADERHPSISKDGRRLAFERHDSAAGTTRIIAADVATGQTLDLFDAFEAVRERPTSPVISPDGSFVTTGSEGHGLFMRSLRDFPTGVSLGGSYAAFQGDELLDPIPSFLLDDKVIAYRRSVPLSTGGTRGEVRIERLPGSEPGDALVVRPGAVHVAHPAIASATMIYDVHVVDRGGAVQQGDIAFCRGPFAADDVCLLGRGVLPRLVSSLRNESSPAFTPDGGEIGFIRDESNGHERVYVFDTATQTLLDPGGADLGLVHTPDTGSLSLYEKPVFLSAALPRPGMLDLNLAGPSGVGLLVQRVTGHHRLLGRRVPTLKRAGRIPLGRFRHGRHTIHWHARGLRPGRYQFTPRALTKSGRVRDLGRPRIFRIR